MAINKKQRGQFGGYKATVLSYCGSHPGRLVAGVWVSLNRQAWIRLLLSCHPCALLQPLRRRSCANGLDTSCRESHQFGDFPLLPPLLVPSAALRIVAGLNWRRLFVCNATNGTCSSDFTDWYNVLLEHILLESNRCNLFPDNFELEGGKRALCSSNKNYIKYFTFTYNNIHV